MRRPTTLRQARGKREMWPHVVDARRLAPVCHRAGDGWETRLEPFTPTEDMRPVCTKCHERIEPDERHVDVFDRPTFFQHLKCPERRGHPPSPSTVVDVTKFATPAPPVDEELERERKRLVGKRIRVKSSGREFGPVRDVRRGAGDVIMAFDDECFGVGRYARAIEPIPDTKPRETTFGELEIGEWFISPSGAVLQRATDNYVRVRSGGPTLFWVGSFAAPVTRCDPPSKEAAPF